MSETNEARPADWEYHIAQWQSSGLPGTDYCRQHELPYHCFIYWRSKFSKAKAPLATVTRPDIQPPSAFVAVRPDPASRITEAASADSLHLRLPNGLEIRNIYASNVGNVRSLLEGLS